MAVCCSYTKLEVAWQAFFRILLRAEQRRLQLSRHGLARRIAWGELLFFARTLDAMLRRQGVEMLGHRPDQRNAILAPRARHRRRRPQRLERPRHQAGDLSEDWNCGKSVGPRSGGPAARRMDIRNAAAGRLPSSLTLRPVVSSPPDNPMAHAPSYSAVSTRSSGSDHRPASRLIRKPAGASVKRLLNGQPCGQTAPPALAILPPTQGPTRLFSSANWGGILHQCDWQPIIVGVVEGNKPTLANPGCHRLPAVIKPSS